MGMGTGYAGLEIWLTKLRFLPIACASRIRMPDGLESRTSLNMRLYSATALTSPASSIAASVTTAPAAEVINCPLDLRQCRRIDRKLAQAPRQECCGTAWIARHVAAEADGSPAAPAELGDTADEIKHRRIQRIDQLRQRSIRPIAGCHILREIVRPDRQERGFELLDCQRCRRHLNHDAERR